ncbi:MAG TPA: amino acid adenylation domain-containing protein [Candidatus Angelobacter sp.]|nr:amino acid adenylation domain-containing protein [Candidatus Angelobacter sp.]
MHELLSRLSDLNVRLEVRAGKLHVTAAPGVVTPELQQTISLQKKALIEMLESVDALPLQNELQQIVPDPAKRYEAFPLNDVQHAYWIGRSAHIELGAVSTHFYFEIQCGALDLGRLTSSFQKVLRIHDMLRAVVDVNGQQRVLEKIPPYAIAVSNQRGADQQQRETELLRIRSEMSHQVFPCDQWPMFDIRLAQISDEHSLLCVSWDFLMVDAWSMMLVFKQWFGYYQDPDYQVSTPSISFRDYVLAEAKLKEQPDYQRSRDYWWSRLDQLPPAPQLPMVSNIDLGRKHAFRRRRLQLPADQWDLIKTRGRQSGITPSSVLLAAFSTVLNLWCKAPHYCLNLTLFNRLPLHHEVMTLVGDFTNLMALEIDAKERCSFVELAARIQAQFLRDYDHRQVNVVEVLRELVKRRGWQQQAMLPVVFSSTLMLDGKRSDDGGVLERFGPMVYGITQTPQVWLDYQIFEVNGDLVINWDAVEEVFPPGVLDDMFESHQELLHLLVRDLGAWGRQDPAVLPKAQQQIRERVNHTAAEVVDRCLHDLFIATAMKYPDRIALACDAREMRYGELLAHSNLVAAQLIQCGVRPQELVAVVMGKGWEQVVAAMGVLIAGAAYLPIEPHWPTLRRNHILEQGEVHIVLTQPPLNRALEWPSNVHRIEVATQQGLDLLTTAPPIRQSPEDLAYVIFTSGSTGTPKGVMISHRSAVNTVVHVNRMFNVGAGDRVLAVSDLTFDLSVYDLFGILSAGGTIVVPDAALSRDPSHWEDLIRRHEVTIWNSAPPLMGMLVDGWGSDSGRHLSSLRLVLLSGDWIPVPLPDRIRGLSLGAQVISLGGATEGSIWSIFYSVEEVSSDWESIPYGNALPNQHMYVLNQGLLPCPDLVTGDIYIGGLGVALGYWKDPEKTARQFVIHPETGERLYYTGDLGSMCRDGNIKFLGRADSQVKLRGHRVELGEIATCLQSHPDIRDAAIRLLKLDNRTVMTAYAVVDRTGPGRLFEQTEVSTEALHKASSGIEAAAREFIDDADREGLQRFWCFWQDVERVSLRAMLETLQTLELVNGSNALSRLDLLIGSGRVLPQYRRLILRWFTALVDGRHLIEHDVAYTVSGSGISTAENVEHQLLALERSFGSDDRLKGFVEHVASCLRNHLSLLCGEINPLELLFPEGSWRIAESLYERNPAVRHHNRLIASMVSAFVETLDCDRNLRVLEIGAGTGGTATSVLPVLPPARTEYVYTDVSPYFFSTAKEKFKSYPFVRYAVHDLNRDPREQGHQPHSYDLIIATNILHNGRDISVVLRGIHDLLRPGGYLLVLEGTQTTLWMWATVAFLEVVPTYTDSRAESDQPALGVKEWLSALTGAGFEGLQSFPAPGVDPLSELLTAMPQHVIAAQGSAHATRFRPEELATFMRERLPDYMVPQRFVLLDKLPLTNNGKVDLAALPTESALPDAEAQQVVFPRSETEELILNIWRDVLGVAQLSVTANFFEVGGDSLLITEVMRRLNRSRRSPLTIAELFSYPTIRSLADFLSAVPDARAIQPTAILQELPQRAQRASDAIAVIGMSGRFPDAENVEQFWHNVAAGKCAVRHFSDADLLHAGVTSEELANPNYVKAGLVLRDIDLFDAAFFGFTPREAEIMDPQQRFLMECAVAALDTAGYPSEKYAGKIGVFVGKGTSLYLLQNLLSRPDIIQQVGLLPILNVNEKDHAATLISYKLNLTGPSLNVNTTCSTSLVAVHLACESLLNHECEMALAGGVSFVNLRESGYLYQEGQILSPDGICRAFSDDANGAMFGSGVGLVVLKPLAVALRDGDSIQAVIKGTAINNDGALKMSYTAPSLHGQAEVIAKAQARAGISPDMIQMIEAHGTGTRLGDPIEFGALRRVFGGPRPDGTHCSLGSVKTNIGHLDAAAGVAGLIKVVQALKHKQIPPTLHARVATRKVDFADSPFELTSKLKDWPAGAVARSAGVSSFGVGGTNAHIVVEESPRPEERSAATRLQLLPVSAKNPKSLKGMLLALADEFGKRPESSLEDVAFTLQVGRNAHPYRSYIVCKELSDAQGQFANPERLVIERQNEGLTPAVVLLFPGQGSQQKDATYELYKNEPGFRAALDECADIVQQYTGEDLRDWLYTKRPAAAVRGRNVQLEQTAITQPLLFSIEYALARFWESLGVRPVAMLGHSIGEYVAACIAGVFSLPEALALIVARGRLIQSLPPGHMVAVSCGEEQLRGILDGSPCCLAAVNGPSQCVASGPSADITKLQTCLQAAGVSSSLLRTSHAFHSQMVAPILQTFENCVGEVKRSRPMVPFISNVSGTWITDAEAMSPAYWARHLRQTVRFGDGLQQVFGIGNRVLLEVGPGRILTTLVRQTDPSARVIRSLSSERPSQGEWWSFLEAVGQLWQHGVEIDWTRLHEGRQPRRMPLPSYVFDRKRYWVESRASVGPASVGVEGTAEAVAQPADVTLSLESRDRHGLGTEFVSPRDGIEVRLVEIWKSYLGIQNIGVRDSFFELGGDSLLAARVHSQIREQFDVELPLARMFELATIRRISLYISTSRDPGLIDTLPEHDLDDLLAVMESRQPGDVLTS